MNKILDAESSYRASTRVVVMELRSTAGLFSISVTITLPVPEIFLASRTMEDPDNVVVASSVI